MRGSQSKLLHSINSVFDPVSCKAYLVMVDVQHTTKDQINGCD